MVFSAPPPNILISSCDLRYSFSYKGKIGLEVFDNRVLKQTLGPKNETVMGGSWKLHNEEVHYVNYSPNIMRLIKTSTRKWAGLVSRMGEKKNA